METAATERESPAEQGGARVPGGGAAAEEPETDEGPADRPPRLLPLQNQASHGRSFSGAGLSPVGSKGEPRSWSPLGWKAEGNVRFGNEDWEGALAAYRSGLEALEQQEQQQQQQQQQQQRKTGTEPTNTDDRALEIALRSNAAFSLLKLQRYDRAEEECSTLLSISPHNSKALYRRACAREGSYFACSVDDAGEKNRTSKFIERKKELLDGAIADLKQAVQQSSSGSGTDGSNTNENKRKSNAGILKQCRRSLDRLQKEYDRQETRRWQPDGPKQTDSDGNRTNDNNTDSAPPPQKGLQSQQKQDVLRLLLARYQNGRVAPGEAFFLLEWNWWVGWCRYVNFFDCPAAKTKDASERSRRLLSYLPPGASLPLRLRKDYNDDDDDSSDDEDDNNNPLPVVPGPIDNSELTVTPGDVFFEQWYLPVPGLRTGTDRTKTSPGQGDSSVAGRPSLRPNLVRGYHYEILPREVYGALRSWYGEATKSLCRRARNDGTIALYPPGPVLRSSKLGVLDRSVPRCNACLAPGASLRCRRCMAVRYCSRACQESHWRYHRPSCRPVVAEQGEPGAPRKPPEIPFPSEGGRSGLNNLGNTCFMNSALQSLGHATPLTRHFLSNRFRSDLNASNPLGTGGKLAHAYEAFVKDAWMRAGRGAVSPTALKRAIALFAPRFANRNQHDAQEFLAYLLDGLHEDLNRIRRAPYVEMPDVTDGQNTTIAAAEAWNAHRRRNDSLVMDAFYGQFQSTCVCPRCNHVSVSFDAFNHVSLEIPSSGAAWATVAVPVLVHFSDGNRKPVRYGVTLRKQASVLDLKRAVASLSKIPPEKLIVTDVYENSIYKLLDDKQSILSIKSTEDTIVAYEVTPYTVKDTLHMIVTHSLSTDPSRSGEAYADQTTSGAVGGTDGGKGAGSDGNGDGPEENYFGLPFMTSIDAKNSSCRDLWQLLRGLVRRMVPEFTGPIAGEGGSRPEKVLVVHVVDAQGRPRRIVPKMGASGATSVLPECSKTLLSSILGEDCAENFLFLNLVWKPLASNKKNGSRIDPKRFLDFDIDPTLTEAIRRQQSTSRSSTKQGVTLDQCFHSFSRPERLDRNNMWYCSRCKDHVQALKTMKLWRLPNILVVHLKRFEFKHALRRDKLTTYVDFPLAGLDMNAHCARSNTTTDKNDFANSYVPADYDLFAVVNHYGRLGFGHYTSFAMQWDETGISKEWNAFDDSSVHPVEPSEVQSSAAYILFYRRRVFH
ncbi:unnamed protein product [Pseudo-nitzschia multistriata]|uniref:ubiquitinyl hydrolase 1 n=1 Tax=Pseudo-nitzschia multistriata TaxID=183589 RepID=A0A448ZDP4_9STRA|nr:unnamed protein product [Pseudo-nitzschia multistriata]